MESLKKPLSFTRLELKGPETVEKKIVRKTPIDPAEKEVQITFEDGTWAILPQTETAGTGVCG